MLVRVKLARLYFEYRILNAAMPPSLIKLKDSAKINSLVMFLDAMDESLNDGYARLAFEVGRAG